MEVSPEYLRNIDPSQIASLELVDGSRLSISGSRKSKASREGRGSRTTRSKRGRSSGDDKVTYGGVVQEKKNYQLYESGEYRNKKPEPEPEPEPEPPRKRKKEEEVLKKQRKSYGNLVQEKTNYLLYEGGDLTEKVKSKKTVEEDEEPNSCPLCHKKPKKPCCPACQRELDEEEELKEPKKKAPAKKTTVKRELKRTEDDTYGEERKTYTFQTKNRVRTVYEYGDL